MRLWKSQLARHAPELVLLAVFVAFALTTRGFLQPTNWSNLMAQSVPVLLLACGQAAVMLTGGLDLSQGAAVGVFSVLLVAVANHFGSTAAAVVVLLGAVLLGLLNALAAIRLRNSFIATFAMMYVLNGAIIYATDGTPITAMPPNMRGALQWLGAGHTAGAPVLLWLALIPVGVFAWLLLGTRAGLHIYAWGANPDAARLQGVREFPTLWLAYSSSALGSALAAVGLSARVLQGNPQMGEGLLFDSIAACVIGGVALTGGVGGVWCVIRGVALLLVIQNGLYLSNMNSHIRDICVGSMIVVSVLFTQLLVNTRSPKVSNP
jgi:ribose transport system permease protein